MFQLDAAHVYPQFKSPAMTLHGNSGFLFSQILLPDWDSGRNKGETKEIERPAGT